MFHFPTCSVFEHPEYSIMSLWENESQLDFHRTIKCSNHDVSDCWSGLTWMPNELYFWPRRNFSVGMVSFWYRFYKSKKSGADSVRLGSCMAATDTDIFVLSCTNLITCSEGIVFSGNGIVFLQKRLKQTYFYHEYTFIFLTIERSTIILYSFCDICFSFQHG